MKKTQPRSEDETQDEPSEDEMEAAREAYYKREAHERSLILNAMRCELQVTDQIRAAMLAIAPDDSWFATVSCQGGGAGGGFDYTGAYALLSLDEAGKLQTATHSLPVPDAAQAALLALRDALAATNENRLWNGCVASLAHDPGDPDPVESQTFAFAYEDKRGDPDNDLGYVVVTPEELLERIQQGQMDQEAEDDSGQDDSEDDGGYYASEPEACSVPSGPKIKTWTCTWCHQSVEGVNHPASQGCPRNPGRMHAWHD